MKRLRFLGHTIDENGVTIDETRIEAIKNYKRPANVREIQSLVGFTGWHRKFVPEYSDIVAPLVDLTKKNVSFQWSQKHEQAFIRLKEVLTTAPILSAPDYTKPFTIETKSSSIGVSGILLQEYDGKKHVIAYMSAKLNDLQKAYHPIERECLAVIVALEKFRHYVEGNKVTVVTDHNSISWLKNCTDPTGRIARWALRLQAYDYVIKHKKFAKYEPVCVLSREIDLETTPEVEIELFNFDILSLANARLQEGLESMDFSAQVEIKEDFSSELSLIEMIDHKQTRDDWYKEKYLQVKNGDLLKNFKIENEILYHRFDRLKNPFGNEWKICVPFENRAQVIAENHDNTLASHPGFLKTLLNIQQKYYWPSMSKETHTHVAKCEVCRTTKSININTSTSMGDRRETNVPFRLLAADFVGPVTMSKKQNQYLFVVVDTFTKYVWIRPLRTAKSEHIIKFIEEEIFSKFGVCERFICDNGAQFISKIFKEFMQKYGVNICFTPFYYPQANPCERSNKTIMNAIRAYVTSQPDQRTWDEEIVLITCALNNHIHTATEMSPHFAIFGRDMILNGKEYAQIVDPNISHDPSTHEERIRVVHNLIGEHLYKAHERIVKTHNVGAGTREIDLAKDTYLKNMKQSNAGERYSKKLDIKYIPVNIVEKIGSNTFIVADEKGKILGKYHASLLMQK